MTLHRPAGGAVPHLVLLSGNTHRPSKSRALAGFLGEAVAQHAAVERIPLDLLDAGRALGTAYWRKELSEEARGVVEAIEAADALIVAVPVYKGSYPGLFKHLIGLVEPEALAGKPVLVAATGGGQRHALVVEHQLRPLFGFFSAQVAAYSVYAADAEFSDGVPSDPGLLTRIDLAARQFAQTIARGPAGAWTPAVTVVAS